MKLLAFTSFKSREKNEIFTACEFDKALSIYCHFFQNQQCRTCELVKQKSHIDLGHYAMPTAHVSMIEIRLDSHALYKIVILKFAVC